LEPVGAGIVVPVAVKDRRAIRLRASRSATDLWHVWNMIMLARQLGAPAPDLSISAPV
jgi:hypothetical protein